MVPSPSEVPAPDQSTAAPLGITPHPAPSAPGPLPDGQVRVLVVPIVAGLVAGVASLLVGEAILNAYQGDLLPTTQDQPDPEVMRRLDAARIHSATGSFATMGGILGLAMGLAGGLVRRSASAGAGRRCWGSCSARSLVASIALVIVPIFFRRHDPQSSDLVLPLLTHGAIWSTVGAGRRPGLRAGARRQAAGKQPWRGGWPGRPRRRSSTRSSGHWPSRPARRTSPCRSSIATRAMAQIPGRDPDGGRSGPGSDASRRRPTHPRRSQ